MQEAYPDLKAYDSFLKLQLQLADIEQDLERARRYYDATVRENNAFGGSFPVNLFAKIMGYKKLEFFSISGTEANVQEIDF
ncbi:MAG: LemA family protein [Crocinitomicaceae bacterium]|nr:LemA family protein [Crocinitomicaceae bacterium]